MDMILLIVVPVIVAILVTLLMMKAFNQIITSERQEYKLMSFVAAFITGIFAAIFSLAFL